MAVALVMTDPMVMPCGYSKPPRARATTTSRQAPNPPSAIWLIADPNTEFAGSRSLLFALGSG
jgi:hypothetical protein